MALNTAKATTIVVKTCHVLADPSVIPSLAHPTTSRLKTSRDSSEPIQVRRALLVFLATLPGWAPSPAQAAWPSAPRARQAPGPLHRGIHELRDPAGWPAEPARLTGPLDTVRFDDAFTKICRPVASRAVDLPAVAAIIRDVALASDADPFLLAALAYRQGFCTPGLKSAAGIGLLQIQPAMFSKGSALPFPRTALDKNHLLDPRHNLEVGVALLKLWDTEHTSLDLKYGSTPHRTSVAHFIWGDKVWGTTGEDRVLTSRRRLLELYGATPSATHPSWFGFDLVAPLQGAPRLGTSGPGADRAGGAREHRGLDVDAATGEPVRAVADGVIQFAGADMPGKQPARWLTVRRSRTYRSRFGPGGLFVRVNHPQGVRTGYFHLNSFLVSAGQSVKAGDIIGFVGRTGVKQSGSHLHFEVTQNGDLLDPVKFMSAFVLPPEATLVHDFAMAEKQGRLDKERRIRHRVWLRSRRIPTS